MLFIICRYIELTLWYLNFCFTLQVHAAHDHSVQWPLACTCGRHHGSLPAGACVLLCGAPCGVRA